MNSVVKSIYSRILLIVLRYKNLDSGASLKKYSEEIPLEIKSLLRGLSNDDRLGILLALMKSGKMSFKEMKEEFGLHSSSLSNHLTVLQDGSLIENFYEKQDEGRFSYYDVTDIPEMIFDSLLDIMYNPIARTKDHSIETDKRLEKETKTETGSSPPTKTVEAAQMTINSHRYVQRSRLATISSHNVKHFDGAGSI